MPQLPPEVIIQILARLPVKSLLQFKCVCKSWRSLISTDPGFAKLHLQQVKKDPNLNLHRLFLSAYTFQSVDLEAPWDGHANLHTRQHSFPHTYPGNDFEFIGSCDGLVSAVFDSDHRIIVWNPSTDESRQLALPCPFPEGNHFYGFGYDSHLANYKIVRGVSLSSTKEIKLEIFNLKGSMWRSAEDIHTQIDLNGSGTTINGLLHWLVFEGDDAVVVVSFDLAEEKFLDKIAVPTHDSENLGLELMIIGDCLCVCTGAYSEYFEAWALKGLGRQATWTRLFRFETKTMTGFDYWLNVLCVTKNGDVVIDRGGLEISIYNPQKQILKQFRVPKNRPYFEAITYVESLISPYAIDGSPAAADS